MVNIWRAELSVILKAGDKNWSDPSSLDFYVCM